MSPPATSLEQTHTPPGQSHESCPSISLCVTDWSLPAAFLGALGGFFATFSVPLPSLTVRCIAVLVNVLPCQAPRFPEHDKPRSNNLYIYIYIWDWPNPCNSQKMVSLHSPPQKEHKIFTFFCKLIVHALGSFWFPVVDKARPFGSLQPCLISICNFQLGFLVTYHHNSIRQINLQLQ